MRRAWRQWLARPYPLWRGAWREARLVLIVTGLATALILVTRPFGLAGLPVDTAASLVLQLSLACAVTAALLRVGAPLVLQRFWDESQWTVGHELVWACLEVTLLAAALMGVLVYRDFVSPTGTNALIFLGTTALCAAIPIGIRTLLVERWLRERHEQQLALRYVPLGVEHSLQASPPPVSPSPLEIAAQDGALTLSPDTLRYVRAEENYVDVVWLDGNGRKHQLLRATLLDVERQLSGRAAVRCHRSYVVSLAAIERATGNAQGYRLRLSGIDEEIPVSRARVVAFLEAFDRWQQSNASL